MPRLSWKARICPNWIPVLVFQRFTGISPALSSWALRRWRNRIGLASPVLPGWLSPLSNGRLPLLPYSCRFSLDYAPVAISLFRRLRLAMKLGKSPLDLPLTRLGDCEVVAIKLSPHSPLFAAYWSVASLYTRYLSHPWCWEALPSKALPSVSSKWVMMLT